MAITLEFNNEPIRNFIKDIELALLGIKEMPEAVNATNDQLKKLKTEKYKELKDNVSKLAEGFAGLQSTLGGVDKVLGTTLAKGAEQIIGFGEGVAGAVRTVPLLVGGLKALSSTFISLGAALLTNPIFLIGAAITAIVVAVGAVLNSFGLLQPVLDGISAGFKSLVKWLGLSSEEADNNADSLDQLNRVTAAYIDSLESANAESARNIKILEAQGASYSIIAAEQLKIIDNQLKIAAIQKNDAQILLDITKDFNLANDLREKAQERVNALVEKEKDLQTEKKVIAINTAKEIKNTVEENAKKELEILREVEQAKVVVTKEGSTARFDAEINAINAVESFQLLKAKQLGITEAGITILLAENIEKRKKLETEYYAFVNKLSNTSVETKKAGTDLNTIITKRAAEIQAQILNNNDKLDAEIQAKITERKRKELETTILFAQQGAAVLTSLSDAVFAVKKRNLEKGSKEEERVAKQQFKVNKALQLSSAIISGIGAVVEAYKNGMKNPIPLLGPATAGVYAGLAAAFSAANIAKIAATKFEGGSSGGGSAAPAAPSIPTASGGGATPSLSLFGQANTGNVSAATSPTTVNSGGQMMVRAYVSETEITAVQNRNQNYQNNAEL